MLLTARQAQTAKPRAKAYGIPDGGGLILWITPDDHRYWHFRYRMAASNRVSRLGPTLRARLCASSRSAIALREVRQIDMPGQTHIRFESASANSMMVFPASSGEMAMPFAVTSKATPF